MDLYLFIGWIESTVTFIFTGFCSLLFHSYYSKCGHCALKHRKTVGNWKEFEWNLRRTACLYCVVKSACKNLCMHVYICMYICIVYVLVDVYPARRHTLVFLDHDFFLLSRAIWNPPLQKVLKAQRISHCICLSVMVRMSIVGGFYWLWKQNKPYWSASDIYPVDHPLWFGFEWLYSHLNLSGWIKWFTCCKAETEYSNIQNIASFNLRTFFFFLLTLTRSKVFSSASCCAVFNLSRSMQLE